MKQKSFSEEYNRKIKMKNKKFNKLSQQKYVELQTLDEIKSQTSGDDHNSLTMESQLTKTDRGYKKIKQLLRSQDDQHHGQCSFAGQNEYKPFQIPPDFEQARLHGQAKKIGKISQCCICCHLPFKKVPFKLSEKIEKFASVGTAFTLFFYYIKQMVFLLFMVFIVGGLQNLIETYTVCEDQIGCESFLGIIYSRDEERSCAKDFEVQGLLNFITFWILFFSVIIFKIFQDGKDIQLKKKMPNHSDFTILIKNVSETNCEDDLKTFLENKILPGRNVDVVSINRIFKIQEYYELVEEKIRLVNQREKLKKQQINLSQKCKEDYKKQKQSLILQENADELNKQKFLSKKQKNKKLSQINKQYIESKKKNEEQLYTNQRRINFLENKYKDYTSEDIRTSMVFVTFNKYEDCQAIKDKYLKPGFKNTLTYKGKDLRFSNAYEPLDIIWENLETPFRVKAFRKCVLLFLALIITFGGLVAVSAVTLWQKKILDDKQNARQNSHVELSDDIGSYAISLFCTIIIAIINSLLTLILTLFSKYERHNTFTGKSVSISLKLSWVQFINTALVPFVILLILTPPQKQIDLLGGHSAKQDYQQYVIQNIFFIFIGNAIFVPIITLYEPEYIWKKICRWWVQKKPSSCTKTQQQLNKIFEDPEFLISEYYAIVNRIILSGFFYATMLSLGILIECIAMFFLYWSFKRTFIHHSAYPKTLSNELNSKIQHVMFFIPLIFTSGSLIYRNIFLQCQSGELFNTTTIIQLSFGAALIIFHSIFVAFFERFRNKNKNFETYYYEKNVMGLSYEQANPITKSFNPESKQIELIPSKEFLTTTQLDQSQIQEERKHKNNESTVFVDSPQGSNINIRQENKNIFNSLSQSRQKSNTIDGHLITKDKNKNNENKQVINYSQTPEENEEANSNNPSTSIIDYALQNILLRRERENQIISAAFERKKSILIKQQSNDLEKQNPNSFLHKVDENDDDDRRETQRNSSI